MNDRTSISSVAAELIAVIVAVTEGEARVLTTGGGVGLPSGPFEQSHRSLQAGLRSWVQRQTGQSLGYVEQLYTFADRDRTDTGGSRVVSISYLGLTREVRDGAIPEGAAWKSWYRYFPWEDHRAGAPAIIAGRILPELQDWAERAPDPATRRNRLQRIAIDFAGEEHGTGPHARDGAVWNEELVLQRYELLFEAGLVAEAGGGPLGEAVGGASMRHDHRRILATGIARLRAKIKYRPVVFELMAETFTLLQLQRTVEALAGRPLHKQNFRRLIEQQELVEETGIQADTGGRPARLFRFRRRVLDERAVAGTKLPLARPI